MNELNKNFLRFKWVLINKIAICSFLSIEDFNKLFNNVIESILDLCNTRKLDSCIQILKKFIYKIIELQHLKSGKNEYKKNYKMFYNEIDKIFQNGQLFVYCLAIMEGFPIVCIAWLLKKIFFTRLSSFHYLKPLYLSKAPCLKD